MSSIGPIWTTARVLPARARDTSSRALAQSYGLMVNYLYDLDYIEQNHEAYAQQHAIVAASSVSRLVRTPMREVVPISG